MDLMEAIKGVMNYSTYYMMRKQGSSANELEYFKGYEELEKQYQDGLEPEQLGRDIIDAQTHMANGELQ
jgi:hypothetical protein